MTPAGDRERACRPEDLSRLLVERANTGDVEGLVALYEPDAVLALPTGEVAIGAEAIRAAYERLLADRPTFTAGHQRPALVNGELALTSTRIPGGATAEIARRQPDGTWLWMIDTPTSSAEQHPIRPARSEQSWTPAVPPLLRLGSGRERLLSMALLACHPLYGTSV